MTWRPIETAPRDGSAFLTFSPPFADEQHGGIDTAGWSAEHECFWKDRCGFQWVTHWMPMPSPPVPD